MTAPKLSDAQETTRTSGPSAAFVLDGAVQGYRTFATIVGDGNACDYAVIGDYGQWEARLGVYTAATNTLSRGYLHASSTGSAVDFSAGVKQVFLDIPVDVISDLAGMSVSTTGTADSIQPQSFYLPLTHSLVPEIAAGSATPTFTRASTAYVMAYAANAISGDSQQLILCASGEARFQGARRAGENSWWGVFADGTPIPDATMLGYLSEWARTNLCLRSQTLNSSVEWVASNVTVAADSVAAPDATVTADTLTASAGNGTLKQTFTQASAAFTFSIYLKRLTGTGNVDLSLDNGSTWTTKTITSSWARYDITQTLANPVIGIRIVTNADAVYAWGAQVEAAPFASSYIPTTTAAATRNGDVLTYPAAGNAVGAVGSLYCESSWMGNLSGNSVLCDLGSTEFALYIQSDGAVKSYDGSASATGASITAGLASRLAVKWSAPWKIAVNGGIGSDGGTALFTLGSNFTLGADGSGTSNLFGTISNVRIWPFALSDAQLVAITT